MDEIVITKADFTYNTPTVIKNNPRSDLLHQLYILYTSQPEEQKKENRKRYRFWMHKKYPEHCRKLGFNIDKYNSFKEEFRNDRKLPETERYYGYPKEKTYAWYGKFTHLKGEEGIEALTHLIHNAKDMKHRGYSVSKYINGSLKV